MPSIGIERTPSKENQINTHKQLIIPIVHRPKSKRVIQRSLIGKRPSPELDPKPKEPLSKKERRNKHCKKNFDLWLFEECDEKKKKQNQPNSSKNDSKKKANTKFVLKKNLFGIGLDNKKLSENLKTRQRNGPNKSKNTPKNSKRNQTIAADIINKISLKKASTGRIQLKEGAKNQFNSRNTKKEFLLKKSAKLQSVKTSVKDLGYKASSRVVWNSRGQCDEEVKLNSKINKIQAYWAETSLLIPNVFRHVSQLKENPNMLYEYLDLSKKELLVQANGLKAISQAGAPHLQRKKKGSVCTSNKSKMKDLSIRQSCNVQMLPKISASMKGKSGSTFWQDSQVDPSIRQNSQDNNQKSMSSHIRKRKDTIDLGKGQPGQQNFSETNTFQQWKYSGLQIGQDVKTEKQLQVSSPGQFEENSYTFNQAEGKLVKMKLQLSEDLDRASKRIEQSFKKKNSQTWGKDSLENFNNHLSVFNKLLDEEEKLKRLQTLKKIKNGQMNDEDLKNFHSQHEEDWTQKRISLFNREDFKRKLEVFFDEKTREQLVKHQSKRKKSFSLTNPKNISETFQLSDDTNTPKKQPKINLEGLTLKDIVRMELERINSSDKSSLLKQSKRIQKKKKQFGKNSAFGEMNSSLKGRNSKRNLLSGSKRSLMESSCRKFSKSKTSKQKSTTKWPSKDYSSEVITPILKSIRKGSEVINIFDSEEEHDLEISVSSETFSQMSEDSVRSLEEHKRKLTLRLENQHEGELKNSLFQN